MDCIFCQIAQGDIPAKLAYQDDKIIAFHDLSPQAPVHLLIIPRKHIPTLLEITAEDAELMGHLLSKVPQIAQSLDLQEGFRLVANCKAPAGQAVYHLHFHLMGKRNFSWPPG